MIGAVRKIAVLMVVFSGTFLFINLVFHTLLSISNTSWIYILLQIAAMSGLVFLLVTKRIEIC
jgi:hypothetical protein